jgi:hypothetical protein
MKVISDSDKSSYIARERKKLTELGSRDPERKVNEKLR